MKLTTLSLIGCSCASDLSVLRGMPLSKLNLDAAGQIQDLTPLKDMPLKYLSLASLDQLHDLTPIEKMSLEEIYFEPKKITKGIQGIRRMQSLKLIGTHPWAAKKYPAEEFWKRR